VSIAKKMQSYIERSSWIRKMFEEGVKLKKLYGEDEVFDLSLGNPDLPPPSCIRETLKNMWENYEPSMHRYMPNAGFPFVRELVAEKASKDYEVSFSPEDIVLTCGAAGALNVIFKALLNPGEEVVFPKPFFVEYVFYAENHQGIPKPVNTKSDFSLDLDALEEAITPSTKVVLLNSPNNPTGVVYSEEELRELSNLLKNKSKKYGKTIYLVSDEPYRNLVFDGVKVPSLFKFYESVIVAYSFSKELSLAGERIGFIAVSPFIKDKNLLVDAMILANRILGFVNAPAISQRLIAACLSSKVDIRTYERRRNLLIDVLRTGGLEFVMPKGGFFVFPKTPIDDVKFCEVLKKYRILAVPGRGFGLKNHIRLSFCVKENVILKMKEGFVKACQEALKQKDV